MDGFGKARSKARPFISFGWLISMESQKKPKQRGPKLCGDFKMSAWLNFYHILVLQVCKLMCLYNFDIINLLSNFKSECDLHVDLKSDTKFFSLKKNLCTFQCFLSEYSRYFSV